MEASASQIEEARRELLLRYQQQQKIFYAQAMLQRELLAAQKRLRKYEKELRSLRLRSFFILYFFASLKDAIDVIPIVSFIVGIPLMIILLFLFLPKAKGVMKKIIITLLLAIDTLIPFVKILPITSGCVLLLRFYAIRRRRKLKKLIKKEEKRIKLLRRQLASLSVS